MAGYGINTGGGLAGGLAEGLKTGVDLGQGIEKQANDENVQQQELGMRKQELGFAQQANTRANTAQGMELNKTAIDALSSQRDQLRSLYAAETTPAIRADLDNHLKEIDAQISDRYGRLVTGKAANGYQQTMSDAAGFQNGKLTPEQVGPVRTSNVASAALGFPAQQANDAGDHNGDGQPDGTSPASQDMDAIHLHAPNGNWSALLQPMHRYVSAHHSHLPTDHDDYRPGLMAGEHGMEEDDPNMPHAPVAQAADILSRKLPIVAHINATPEMQDMLNQAHDQGATQEQDQFFGLARKYGGAQNLVKAANTPDSFEKTYRQNAQAAVANGADPVAAHQAAVAQTVSDNISDIKTRVAAQFLSKGWPVPEQYKLTEREQRVASAIAAGYSPKDAVLVADAPAVLAEREKALSDKPLKESEISRNYSLGRAADRRGVGSDAVPVTGSDGNTYIYHKGDQSYTNADTGEDAPQGLHYTASGRSGRGSGTDLNPSEIAKEQWKADHEAWVKDPRRKEKGEAPKLADYIKNANAPAASGTAAPAAGGAAAPAGATAAPVDANSLNPVTGKPWGH